MHVFLEELNSSSYRCLLAYMEKNENNIVYTEVSSGKTAKAAYCNLINKLCKKLSIENDEITVIDNPCNTELLGVDEQKKCHGNGNAPGIAFKKNGNEVK